MAHSVLTEAEPLTQGRHYTLSIGTNHDDDIVSAANVQRLNYTYNI